MKKKAFTYKNIYLQKLVGLLSSLYKKSFTDGFTEIQKVLFQADIKKHQKVFRSQARSLMKIDPHLFQSSIQWIPSLFENFESIMSFGSFNDKSNHDENWERDLSYYQENVNEHYKWVIQGLQRLDQEAILPNIKVGNKKKIILKLAKQDSVFRKQLKVALARTVKAEKAFQNISSKPGKQEGTSVFDVKGRGFFVGGVELESVIDFPWREEFTGLGRDSQGKKELVRFGYNTYLTIE